MRCPECQSLDSKVIDSRTAGDAIRRRRQCSRCGTRFTTHERIERRMLWVDKRSGDTETWQPDKILQGVALACRKRPVSSARLERLVRDVEARFDGVTRVHTDAIGEAVIDELAAIDAVATIRFASVHRAFEDLDQFVAAIRPMRDAAKARE